MRKGKEIVCLLTTSLLSFVLFGCGRVMRSDQETRYTTTEAPTTEARPVVPDAVLPPSQRSTTEATGTIEERTTQEAAEKTTTEKTTAEQPKKTEEPAATEEPTEKDRPTTSEEPTEKERPTTTETAKNQTTDTEAPATTEDLPTTQAHTTPDKPDSPLATEAPTTTQAPAVTEAPTTTQAPAVTEAPTTTQAPAVTEAATGKSNIGTEIWAEGSETFRNISKTVIGDSIMEDAADTLLATIPNTFVDAKVSRQFSAAMDIAIELDVEGLLGDVVIVELGTNGNFTYEKGQELINFLGPNRTIFWINVCAPVEWMEQVNATIDALAENNGNVCVIDWAGLASGHTEWFYNDMTHPNVDGRNVFVTMVYNYLVSAF